MTTTLDFHIRPTGPNAFSLEVFRRDSAQPLATSSFEYDVSYLTQFEINQLEPDERDAYGRMERLRAFGKRLYDKLFTPSVAQVWTKTKHESDFLTLCIRIDPQAATLETLPWETLYDGEEFLAAGAKTGVSRLPLDVPVRDKLPPVPAPLKMLAVMSSPLDLQENERLQIEREQEILLQAVNTPSGQGKLLLDLEDEAKLPVIESSLEGGCQVLHYSGHGIAPEDGGGLLLEDAQGNRRPTGVAEIMQSLEKAEHSLRLVVISGCQTCKTLNTRGFQDMARGLLRREIPAVVAMQFSILDSAGMIFAESLYPHLVEGQSLDVAVSTARRVLLHSEDVRIQSDALAPVLFASSSRPLDTTRVEGKEAVGQPKIDFSLHLPLPQLKYGFYGRRREYRMIRDGIIGKNHRAVIVYGIGGIGKTAVISHTATRLRDHFRGVYAFDCTSSVLAPETILLELHRYLERQGIKVFEQLLHQSIPPDQLAGFVGQVLSQWPLLLIFDNFETHLTAHEGDRHRITDENLGVFLKTLVKTTATGTRFLFTTRYLFDLDAKRIGDIQEISLGDLSRPEALGLMQRLPCMAAAPFESKLRAFDTFGGHPYALVTLDRHCAHRPLADVLSDAADVHAELREFLAIELNYRKLSDLARELLNRLAAFRKPVPLGAAQWVMGETTDSSAVARDLLKRLDRKAMPEEMQVMTDEQLLTTLQSQLPEVRQADIGKEIEELIGWGLLTPIGEDGKARGLSIHSLVRDFCRDKAGLEDWRRNLRNAAAYYKNQTKLLEQDYKSPAAVWMEIEAFEAMLEAEQHEEAASVLMAADPLLDRWGFGRVLESLYDRIINHVEERTKCKLHGNLGVLLMDRGCYDDALRHQELAKMISQEVGDDKTLTNAVHNMGMVHQKRGDYDKAIQCYQDARSIVIRTGDRAALARSYAQVGVLLSERSDYSSALKELEKARELFMELGDRSGAAKTLYQLAVIHCNRAEYDKAVKFCGESLRTAQELLDRASISKCLFLFGRIHQARGNYEGALQFYERSYQILQELDDRRSVAAALLQIGRIHEFRRDHGKALEYYERSRRLTEELGDRAGYSRALHSIGIIHQLRGNYDQARDYFEWSRKIAEELGDRAMLSKALHQIGMVHQERGEYDKALEYYEQARKIIEELGDRAGLATSHGQIGRLCLQTGRPRDAFEHFLPALTIFTEIGSPGRFTTMNHLRRLRRIWGEQEFDKVWRQRTGQEVPEWVKKELAGAGEAKD